MSAIESILDLDNELIYHCANPESAQVLLEESISTELVFDKFARDVYEFQMSHMRKYRKAASAEVLIDEFDGFNNTPVLELCEPVTVVEDLLDRLRQRYIRYEGKNAVNKLSNAVIEDPLSFSTTLLNEGRRLSDLTVRRGGTYGTGDFDKAWKYYLKKQEEGDRPTIGYSELDNHFGGLLGLTFLLGSKKSMKSWVTLHSFVANILMGNTCHLYALELPESETYWRMACMAANIPFWKYHKGALMPSDEKELEKATKFLDECGLFTIEKPGVGGRGVQRMIEHALNNNSDLIYIDQLQYVETRNGLSLGAQNNTGQYWEVCNDLRDYSDQIPIWCVHQINRTGGAQNEFPTSDQGKGSAALEETATLELGVWASKEMRANHLLQFGTLESRNAEHKHWHLNVNLNTRCSFEMIEEISDVEFN